MKRVIWIAVCSVILLAAVAVAAGDIEIQGPLFVPIAYITQHGKIMDKNHVLMGRIDTKGIVYDLDNRHLGFIEKDLTVLDVHYKTMATIDEDGVITDGGGTVIGAITDTKLSDAEGRPIIRYEGPQDKRAILAYFFFFSGGSPN
jgi:hypothetical protein